MELEEACLEVLGSAAGTPRYRQWWLVRNSVISEQPRPPKPQVVFWDIPLTATESDVKFLKGAATKIIDGGLTWVYENTKSSSGDDDFVYVVKFRDGKVRSILYFGPGDPGTSHIEGVGYGESYQSVIDTFGPPSYVSIAEDDLERILSFERFNVVFGFARNKVYVYGIYDPKFGPVRLKKDKPQS
jgi:hypothetical protein